MESNAGNRLAALALALGCALFAVAAGLCFLAGALFPYERLREVLEASSNMGSASFFTEPYYAGVLLRAKLAGFFCLLSAAGLAGLRRWSLRPGRRSPGRDSGAASLAAWARQVGGGLKADRAVWALLAVSVVLRLPFLFQPASSDEVRGYYAWTARPFVLAISDYRAPQHLLYTVLDYPVVRMFGNGEWAIRLPAFAAGILLPVLIYLAGRKWFGRSAGLMAGALIAANPVFVHFSVNGRAYTLHAGMVLLLWLAAVQLGDQPRARWRVLLVCAGAVGLMALPTMAYPLAGTYLWLLASLVQTKGGGGEGRGKQIGHLVICGLATIWLAGLAYLPAYVASDRWYSVDATEVAVVVPWLELPGRLLRFAQGAFWIWNEDIPGPGVALLLVFFVVGTVASWKKRAFHLLAFNVLAILGVSLASRIVPYSRMALYFSLAYFLVAGSGLGVAIDFMAARLGPRRGAGTVHLAAGLVALLLAIHLAGQNKEGFTTVGVLSPGIRDLMDGLKGQIAPGDHLICTMGTSGPLYYYHLRNHMDGRLWFIPDEYPPPDILSSPQGVYIVANLYGGESLESVLRACCWPPDLLDPRRFALAGSNAFAAAYRRSD